jgi:hypothetical protein
MTIEDIEKEIAEEAGGQIVRDIERLYGEATDTLAAKPQKIFIGWEEVEVVISPKKRTKFIGVAPSDVSLSDVAQELYKLFVSERSGRAQGTSNFVALGLNYTEKELKEAAEIVIENRSGIHQ